MDTGMRESSAALGFGLWWALPVSWVFSRVSHSRVTHALQRLQRERDDGGKREEAKPHSTERLFHQCCAETVGILRCSSCGCSMMMSCVVVILGAPPGQPGR